GTPRKACITRRRTFSFTGEILEELTDRLRSVQVFLLQDLLETSSEIRGQIVQRFEQRLEKLLCARTGHRELSSSEKKVNAPEEYEELLPGVNRDDECWSSDQQERRAHRRATVPWSARHNGAIGAEANPAGSKPVLRARRHGP